MTETAKTLVERDAIRRSEGLALEVAVQRLLGDPEHPVFHLLIIDVRDEQLLLQAFREIDPPDGRYPLHRILKALARRLNRD